LHGSPGFPEGLRQDSGPPPDRGTIVWEDGGVRYDVKIAIFDLDGTVTDSQEGIVASFRHALQALDLPADDDMIRHQIGPPLIEGFTALGVPVGQLDSAVNTYRSFFSHTGIYMNQLYEGVEGMLASLTDSGIGLALATSKLTEFARRILEYFDIAHVFSEVVGSTADGRIVTKQAIVADALDRLGGPDPSTMVLAGDRHQDMRAAVALGLVPVGVTWGYGSVSELIDSGARHLVADPAELVSLVLAS
jgi:phosphoglycolate phosphatase